jgi:hypothetical protein
MTSKKVGEGLPLLGLGILGLVHEFVISDKAEVFAIIIFGAVAAKGISKLFEKK